MFLIIIEKSLRGDFAYYTNMWMELKGQDRIGFVQTKLRNLIKVKKEFLLNGCF